jgi:hypothetical protein
LLKEKVWVAFIAEIDNQLKARPSQILE